MKNYIEQERNIVILLSVENMNSSYSFFKNSFKNSGRLEQG